MYWLSTIERLYGIVHLLVEIWYSGKARNRQADSFEAEYQAMAHESCTMVEDFITWIGLLKQKGPVILHYDSTSVINTVKKFSLSLANKAHWYWLFRKRSWRKDSSWHMKALMVSLQIFSQKLWLRGNCVMLCQSWAW